jgi:hypothetical protein
VLEADWEVAVVADMICRCFKPSDGLAPSTLLTMEDFVFSGGFEERLPALFSVDLCAFGVLIDLFLEMPWAALRNPVPVPKTCPQTVRSLENASWVRWCDG